MVQHKKTMDALASLVARSSSSNSSATHTDVVIGHMSASQATVAMAMGYVALTLFVLAAVLTVVALYMLAKMKEVEFIHVFSRSHACVDVVGTLILACGWAVAGLSDKTLDGCVEARVILNVFAWGWTLDVLINYFHVYKNKRASRFIALGSLVIAALGTTTLIGGTVKYVGLLFVAVAAIIFALPGCLLSTDPTRAIIYASVDSNKISFTTNKTSRIIACVVAIVGVYTLLFELLSNEYTGTLGPGVSFVPMFFGHSALLFVWVFCAFTDFFDQPLRATSISTTSSLGQHDTGSTSLMDDGVMTSG